MRDLPRLGRRLAVAFSVAVTVAAAGAAVAQELPASQLLTIDQERLFIESAFGKAVLAREAASAKALEAENARIEAGLVDEEQDLTDRRPTLAANEFSALATAFDEKVVRIRSEQDTKARELTRLREGDRQAFFRAAVPVLGDLLGERKAVAIVDKSVLILSLSAIDVTDAAIAKVDAALLPGSVGTEAPEAGPETGPAPAPAPEPSATP